MSLGIMRIGAQAFWLLAAVNLLAIFSTATRAESEPTGSEVMTASRLATLVDSAIYKITFVITEKSSRRSVRSIESKTKLRPGTFDNRRYSRFTAPPDALGVATLLIEYSDAVDDMWVFLPALKRARRVIADNKKDSFMGTELTYGDVIGHPLNRWRHEITGQPTFNGEPYWEIMSVPIGTETSEECGYSRRLSRISKRTFVADEVQMWDLEGRSLKSIWSRRVEPIEGAPGKYIAREVEVFNQQVQRRTLITIDSFEVGTNIPDAQFSSGAMEYDSVY